MGLNPIDRWIQFDMPLYRMAHGSHLYVAVMRNTGVIPRSMQIKRFTHQLTAVIAAPRRGTR